MVHLSCQYWNSYRCGISKQFVFFFPYKKNKNGDLLLLAAAASNSPQYQPGIITHNQVSDLSVPWSRWVSAQRHCGITVTWSGARGPLTPPSRWDRRVTRYGTWWIQPSPRSFTPVLSPRLLFPACHRSTFFQTDSCIWFYIFLIEPESRVEVKCTFRPTLTLCRITEAEPFSLALDTFSRSSHENAHAASRGLGGGGWDPSLARTRFVPF